jgi:hypothetical protein
VKKTIFLALILLLLLTFSITCEGTFNVQPRELTITMDNEFINGNTQEKITIINNNNFSTNISWYIEHPNPISYLRPNKTCMPNLSWIDVKPQWQILSLNGTAEFYIYLNIPENDEHLDQHWETWITFKEEPHEFINIESAVRIYIDTPEGVPICNNNKEMPLFYVVLLIVIVIALLIISILIVKKKKS